jgi:hypothetical protein
MSTAISAPECPVAALRWLLMLLGSLMTGGALAQNATRLLDENTIGWFTNTTTLKVAERWSGHFEYQFRREDVVRTWQQSLLRTGINYRLNDQVTVRLGYAWIETFPYGDFPIQAAGRQFPEHRTYQLAQLRNPVGRTDITHRFMLEQRWIGRFSNAQLPRPDETVYSNRVRYMLRLQYPFRKDAGPTGKTFYAAAYDEVFVNFGQNVGVNVFDQNRLGLLLGYRFSPAFRLEGGYLQQIVQLPREIQERNVFQFNNGLIVNTILDLDLRRN